MIRPNFEGETVICVASGPSLTQEDCDLVRESGHPVIVVNTSFRLAPWADMLFAFDKKWWDIYHEEVNQTFGGLLVSFSQAVKSYGVESTYRAPWFANYGNSGACAIGLAMAGGADKIVLLGYDCQAKEKAHWHGDHPAELSNIASIKRWPAQFKCVADDADRDAVIVLNASRETALKCFARITLENAL